MLKLFLPVIIICLSANAYAQDKIRIQLKPSQEARINSPMTGQITNIIYKDGEAVTKGKTLVEFRCNKQNAALSQAQARIERQSGLVKSTQKLFDLGGANQTDLDVLKAELKEAKATKELAYADIKDCKIKAPFTGIISGMSVKNHYSVQEGEAILEMVDDHIEIEMIVPSKWMTWLKPETDFNISIDETGKKYPSQIVRLGGRVDPVTQSVKAYAKLKDNASDLLVGMSGEAIFEQKYTEPNHKEETHDHAEE